MRGCFFLAGSHATHMGPERVADLLNAETGFFPFELPGEVGSRTVLIGLHNGAGDSCEWLVAS